MSGVNGAAPDVHDLREIGCRRCSKFHHAYVYPKAEWSFKGKYRISHTAGAQWAVYNPRFSADKKLIFVMEHFSFDLESHSH